MRVISRQAKDEEEQVLMKLTEQKKEIEEKVDSELQELHVISHNCEGDIHSIGKKTVLVKLLCAD